MCLKSPPRRKGQRWSQLFWQIRYVKRLLLEIMGPNTAFLMAPPSLTTPAPQPPPPGAVEQQHWRYLPKMRKCPSSVPTFWAPLLTRRGPGKCNLSSDKKAEVGCDLVKWIYSFRQIRTIKLPWVPLFSWWGLGSVQQDPLYCLISSPVKDNA